MLANKALLVHLGISQWTGRRLDKRATGTVEASHATQKHVGNFTKKLLPGAKELEKINALAGALRKFFYLNTLPWLADGTRIISSKNYLEFTGQFRTKKQEFEDAVSEFLRVYPALVIEARMKLGDLFSGAEYPTAARLESCFRCEISFLPMPSVEDFRTEMLDSEKNEFLSRMRDVEAEAVRDCWNRLHSVVSKAAERLADPNANFRESLLENISEVCALLPKLNITEDAELESARQSVESAISAVTASQLKSSATDRESTAAALKAIESKMGIFLGVQSSQAEDAQVIAARLGGAKFEGSQGTNLADGIIITKGVV